MQPWTNHLASMLGSLYVFMLHNKHPSKKKNLRGLQQWRSVSHPSHIVSVDQLWSWGSVALFYASSLLTDIGIITDYKKAGWHGHRVWRTIWRVLKKLKIELPYDPAIPLLGIYLEKIIIWSNTCTPKFIVALFTIAKKQPKCPSTEEWIKKCSMYM